LQDNVVFANTISHSENPNKIINKPIYYASRLMNNAKKNYTTTKKNH